MTKQSKAILAKYENEEFFHKEIRDSFRTLLELNEKLVEVLEFYGEEHDWRNHWFGHISAVRGPEPTKIEEFCGWKKAKKALALHKDAMKSLAGEE